MGGADKALTLFQGKPLIAHVAGRLAEQVDELIINANGDPGRFAQFSFPVVSDGEAERMGPLAGVLAGLDWAAAHRPAASHIATASCDTPFLPSDFISVLADAVAPGGAAIAKSGGRTHPTCGLWPVSTRDALREALLVEGLRKCENWITRRSYAYADFPAKPVDPFFNVNTLADLSTASKTP